MNQTHRLKESRMSNDTASAIGAIGFILILSWVKYHAELPTISLVGGIVGICICIGVLVWSLANTCEFIHSE